MDENKRNEAIDELQDRVFTGDILTLEQLVKEYKEFDIEPFEDVLSPMDWNSCDRCGQLDVSEHLLWVDYLGCDSAHPDDEDVLKGIEKENGDYVAICSHCASELKKKGQAK